MDNGRSIDLSAKECNAKIWHSWFGKVLNDTIRIHPASPHPPDQF